MVRVDWQQVINGVSLTVLGVLPFTGYWYYSSHLFEACTERLDVFLTFGCFIIWAMCLGTYRAVQEPNHSETGLQNVGLVIFSWFVIGGLLAAHNLQAVISCWLHFKDNEHYSGKHVAVFILYGLFALIYGLILTGIFLYLLFSEDTSPFRIWRKEKDLLKDLLDWRTAHICNSSSQKSHDLFQTIIWKLNVSYGTFSPRAIRVLLSRYFFQDVVFQVYPSDTSELPEGAIICSICSTTIIAGENYWVTSILLSIGPVHFDCFERTKYQFKAIQNLNADVCAKLYTDLRSRANPNT